MELLAAAVIGLARFVRAFVWCAAMFALVIYATGCNSLPPPAAINVESDASPVVAEAIAAAREAWCVADVGWCPDLVSFGGAEIEITRWDDAGHTLQAGETMEETGWTGPAAHTDAWRIEVAPEFATAEDLTWVLVHEFGHFCINDYSSDTKLVHDGHVPTSKIMRAAQLDGRPTAEVDAPARRAWLQSCPR